MQTNVRRTYGRSGYSVARVSDVETGQTVGYQIYETGGRTPVRSDSGYLEDEAEAYRILDEMLESEKEPEV